MHRGAAGFCGHAGVGSGSHGVEMGLGSCCGPYYQNGVPVSASHGVGSAVLDCDDALHAVMDLGDAVAERGCHGVGMQQGDCGYGRRGVGANYLVES